VVFAALKEGLEGRGHVEGFERHVGQEGIELEAIEGVKFGIAGHAGSGS
jgi:hypothetical protein